MDRVAYVDMPTLLLASDIAPWLSIFMGIVIFAMVFSTAASALYAFSTRIVNPDTPNFKFIVIGFSILAYGLSFVGFSTLVGTVYPMFGYLGLLLIVIVFIQWIRHRNGNPVEDEKKAS